jgi:hypothetical protein
MPKFTKKKVVAVVALSMMAVGGGAAYAYWTTTGSGSGNATNASSNGTLDLHANFTGGLTPGATRTVTYTADNSNTSSLWVGSLTPVVSVDSAHSACTPADNFTITATAPGTQVLAGAAATVVGSGTLKLLDTTANQDACKGAVVTVSVTSL